MRHKPRLGYDEVPGASYDEARRSRERSRRSGGADSGGNDKGLHTILVIAVAIVLIVVGRLLWLQVFTASDLSSKAEAQRTNAITLHARRGTIYDRNGNVLATSVDCKTIYANPEEVNDPSGAADMIAEVLGGSASDYIDKLQEDTTFVYIRRQVDEDEAEELQQKLSDAGVEGIYFLDDTKRVYPYGSVAGQILGVVGVDGDGLSGLELYYNDVLQGTDGQMLMETGQDGTPIAGAPAEVTPAKDGTDIVISIDINIQQVAEEQIAQGVKDYNADSGSVMVIDPQTGEILAACSTPLLDPTDTSEATADAFSLKFVSSSYEPGSIFKVLTAAIGINDGLMNTETTWSVPAQVKAGDDYVTDVDGRDYTMDMSLREILRRSSNVGMSLVAQSDIGAERFSSGVSAFQIGTATGIDYPGETAGIVKTLDQYDGSTLGNMAFGQGLAMPIVQMVKAVGSIANGGTLYTPHFLVSEGDQAADWPSVGTSVSSEACSEVTDMMRTVVDSGTAVNGDVEGYDVAAKTGTGQQVNDNGVGYKEDSYMSSMIGFANASDPSVLVYVGLNGTSYHGSAAGPMFSAIMSEALSDMGVKPSD
jgi:cell division protein FtsI/penicillin-binding protein 2